MKPAISSKIFDRLLALLLLCLCLPFAYFLLYKDYILKEQHHLASATCCPCRLFALTQPHSE
ncbi:MAG: hypothetical protein PHI97_10060 [Desulfobulbus sp.]|nr:hypothetical protein [Desulfobulbus sp.]